MDRSSSSAEETPPPPHRHDRRRDSDLPEVAAFQRPLSLLPPNNVINNNSSSNRNLDPKTDARVSFHPYTDGNYLGQRHSHEEERGGRCCTDCMRHARSWWAMGIMLLVGAAIGFGIGWVVAKQQPLTKGHTTR